MVNIKMLLHSPVSPSFHSGVHYLKEDIRGIVQTHDHRARSDHVVRVGKRDEQYGGQVVDEHDHEILPSEGEGEKEAG